MSKYLVLGASGFLGRNFCEQLKKEGHEVIGTYYSRVPRFLDARNMEHVDLTDQNQAHRIMDISKPDYVIMAFAKTYGIGISANRPEDMVRDNIVMNVNVLDACLRHKVGKVLFISSSTVYQEIGSPYMAESELDLNQEPYYLYKGVGWVKRYTEKLCEFYHSRGLDASVVRPTNIYGPYDSYALGSSHVVPALIKRALDKEIPYKVWGSGQEKKDFLYVDDFVRDALMVLREYGRPDPINLCSYHMVSIKTLADMVLKITDHDVAPEFTGENRGLRYRELDRKKFDDMCWSLEGYVGLVEGLKKTVTWIEEDSNAAAYIS